MGFTPASLQVQSIGTTPKPAAPTPTTFKQVLPNQIAQLWNEKGLFHINSLQYFIEK